MGLIKNLIQYASNGFQTEEDRMRSYFADHAKRNNPSPSTYEEDLASALLASVAPHLSDGYEVAPAPQGSFSSLRDAEDRKLAQRAGADIGGIQLLALSVKNTGILFDADIDANGIMILSRAYDQNDAVTESSDSARISIEVNRSGVYLPFSYEVLGQGVQKSDMVVFTGKASHLRIRCVIPTQNNKQPYMLVLLTKDIGLAGPWGGIQLYQRPASAAGNPQQSASAEQITGGATAPVTSPVSGGGGTTSSGGTFTGGGGGGTGGGGRKQVL